MTSGPTAGPGTDDDRATYLIVLRHVLVAQDIAMTISDTDPEARIVTAASEAEALPRLAGVDRLTVAFVGQAPRAYGESALARAVRARGGRVVLLGEEAEAEGAAMGYAVLVRPFATASILQHLAEGAG
jgi:hypothetical protein